MKIGLALSGGGALGAAHISLLEGLEANDINVEIIAGTSAGSIIAAVYASGGLEAVHGFYNEIERLEIFNHKKPFNVVTPARFFEMFFAVLDKYCVDNVEETKISLKIAATNLKSGELEVFEKGKLVDAVRASSAYPGVFSPQKIGSEYYIDGGLTCNLPAQLIRNEADFLIGSNLYDLDPISDEKMGKLNRARIVIRAMDIIQKELARQASKDCNFCFNISPEKLRWYSFNRIGAIKEKGMNQVQSQLPELLTLLKRP